ncbi:MAG: hypothetical protein ABIS28_04860 [Caldimonas sp.]
MRARALQTPRDDLRGQCERDGSVAHAKGRARESNPYVDEDRADPTDAVARIEAMLRDAWWRGWDEAERQSP